MKPASNINSWKDWPADVVQTLRLWNHASSQRLRFTKTGPFICAGCGAECMGHTYGTAVLDGSSYCDDDLIESARNGSVVLGTR